MGNIYAQTNLCALCLPFRLDEFLQKLEYIQNESVGLGLFCLSRETNVFSDYFVLRGAVACAAVEAPGGSPPPQLGSLAPELG